MMILQTLSPRVRVSARATMQAHQTHLRMKTGSKPGLSMMHKISLRHSIVRLKISFPMIPVAAPDHPLAHLASIPPGAARDHVQLVLTDRSPLTAGRDFSVLSSRTWRLADLGAKHALLREGIGWGNMPLPMIAGDLASGALVRLRMADHPGGIYRFAGIWRREAPPGPAASWLLAQFETATDGDEMAGLPDV